MHVATDQSPGANALNAVSNCFLAMQEEVLAHWASEARERVSGANETPRPILMNSLPAFYANIAEALAPSHPRDIATSDNNAASEHGGERARMTPIGPDQLVLEYQIFRESIAAVALGRCELAPADWAIIDRSINTAMIEAVRGYMATQDEIRDQVAAALSHDMRTPLAVITVGAQLIALSAEGESAKRAASKIESSARRLGTMMEDMLDAIAHNRGAMMPLSLSHFDIQQLIVDVAQDFSGRAAARLEIKASPIEGHWCRSALRRALENLIDNAIKYGDGGVVIIEASEVEEKLMLSVRNTGRAIPKGEQTRVFDYLARASTAEGKAGWGIGLQLVKAVTHSHGGSVCVDSSDELGTTFLIDIPLDCRPFATGAATVK